MHEEVEINTEVYNGREFWDHVNGGKLIKSKVIAARTLEMDYVKRLGVYEKIPRWQAGKSKIVSVRWIDTNKGDDTVSDYRSRLVAREIKKDKRLDLFVATPR